MGALRIGLSAYILTVFVLVASWPQLALSGNLAPTNVNASPSIRVIASEFPPYSFMDKNGNAKGIAVDAVREILRELGMAPSIDVYSWARAYKIAQDTPNTLLFSVARTYEREDLFTWIGQIIDFDVRVYRKASRDDIVIGKLEDLKSYTFAGLRKDVKTGFLDNLGVVVDKVSKEENIFKMLNFGRTDLVASDKSAAAYQLNKLGYDQKDFVIAYKLSEISRPLYLVANKGTDALLVEQLRKAILSRDQQKELD